jgi:hypothetical protein
VTPSSSNSTLVSFALLLLAVGSLVVALTSRPLAREESRDR